MKPAHGLRDLREAGRVFEDLFAEIEAEYGRVAPKTWIPIRAAVHLKNRLVAIDALAIGCKINPYPPPYKTPR